MAHLPEHVTIGPDEHLVALIHPDFEVQTLWDALLTTLWLILGVMLTIGLDQSLDRAWSGLGPWLLLTIAFFVGPMLAQRILAPRRPYVLTDARLIVDAQTEIALARLGRLRAWPTSLVLQADGDPVSLTHLINPPAVARLIHDTIATTRRA